MRILHRNHAQFFFFECPVLANSFHQSHLFRTNLFEHWLQMQKVCHIWQFVIFPAHVSWPRVSGYRAFHTLTREKTDRRPAVCATAVANERYDQESRDLKKFLNSHLTFLMEWVRNGLERLKNQSLKPVLKKF